LTSVQLINRTVRYQAAIIQNDNLLLLKATDFTDGQTFWVIPGGGREEGESEMDCLRREVLEETHLHVKVERLLLDEPGVPGDIYQRLKTYLCQVVGGEARPGIEPEIDTADQVTISAIGWFDLRQPGLWDPLALNDPFTYPLLQRLRLALGYTGGE
jgi:8-oxo-dGTP pyrophosphatase MutT (NUDIX family)